MKLPLIILIVSLPAHLLLLSSCTPFRDPSHVQKAMGDSMRARAGVVRDETSGALRGVGAPSQPESPAAKFYD